MKKWFCAALPALMLAGILSGCGNDIEADLVFVNDSDAGIVEVVVDFQDQNGGSRNADSSPLRRGDSFGFEAGGYPAEGALAQLTIQEAPPEGERWYVTARDGGGGLALTADTRWPEGV